MGSRCVGCGVMLLEFVDGMVVLAVLSWLLLRSRGLFEPIHTDEFEETEAIYFAGCGANKQCSWLAAYMPPNIGFSIPTWPCT